MLRQAAAIAATAAVLMGAGCGGRATSDPDGVDALDPTGGTEAGDTSGGAGADDPSGGAGAAEPSGGTGAEAGDPAGGSGAEPSVTGGDGSGGDGGAPADVEPDPCAGVTTDFYFQCYGECSTWTDDSTGLTWTDPPGEDLVWTDALCFCDSLEADGMSDWRLPSIDELRTLITGCEATATGGECGVTDDCLRSTCFDEDACAGCEDGAGPMDGYTKGWYLPEGLGPHLIEVGLLFSGSGIEDEEGRHWGVDFLTGAVFLGNNEGHAFVRCLR